VQVYTCRPMALVLYNTLTRREEPFVPIEPDGSRITFYTCGPTVYDDAHIGNFRSFLAADVLRRWIESPLCEVTLADGKVKAGPRRVVHVMNITDVGHMTDDSSADGSGEDKMEVAGKRLLEAKKAGKLPEGATVDPSNPYDIAAFYTERFLEDARRLGLKLASEVEEDASLMPRATDNVGDEAGTHGMTGMIRRLIERGYAYPVGEARAQTVYFDVQRFAAYGKLSGNTLERLRSGAGGRIDERNQAQKRHPADFMLWKHDPAHVMKWASPWGVGYPGWHIECSVMSFERLVRGERGLGDEPLPDGEPLIDLHSGGEDNIFPHHECEVAQSCCAQNRDPDAGCFAKHWFHGRYLMVEGDKMSKSKGTFYTARDLFAQGHDPAAVRLELIKTHYRSNSNFTVQGLKDSARIVDRWRRFLEAADKGDEGGADAALGRRFAEAMHDDLNVAAAIGALNEWVSGVDAPMKAHAAALREVDEVLGVIGLEQLGSTSTELAIYKAGAEPDERIEPLLAKRRDARKSKDFATADAIRDELREMGYAIKDSADGKVEVSRA